MIPTVANNRFMMWSLNVGRSDLMIPVPPRSSK
jgi:hypothetical protein